MNDDWINAFADVNILQVEAVGAVIGRATAAIYKGMVDAGLQEETARAIIRDALSALFDWVARSRP